MATADEIVQKKLKLIALKEEKIKRLKELRAQRIEAKEWSDFKNTLPIAVNSAQEAAGAILDTPASLANLVTSNLPLGLDFRVPQPFGEYINPGIKKLISKIGNPDPKSKAGKILKESIKLPIYVRGGLGIKNVKGIPIPVGQISNKNITPANIGAVLGAEAAGAMTNSDSNKDVFIAPLLGAYLGSKLGPAVSKFRTRNVQKGTRQGGILSKGIEVPLSKKTVFQPSSEGVAANFIETNAPLINTEKLEAFRKLGIKPTLADLVDNPKIINQQSIAENTFGEAASSKIRNAQNKQMEDLKALLNVSGEKFSPELATTAVKEATEKALENYKKQWGQKFNMDDVLAEIAPYTDRSGIQRGYNYSVELNKLKKALAKKAEEYNTPQGEEYFLKRTPAGKVFGEILKKQTPTVGEAVHGTENPLTRLQKIIKEEMPFHFEDLEEITPIPPTLAEKIENLSNLDVGDLKNVLKNARDKIKGEADLYSDKSIGELKYLTKNLQKDLQKAEYDLLKSHGKKHHINEWINTKREYADWLPIKKDLNDLLKKGASEDHSIYTKLLSKTKGGSKVLLSLLEKGAEKEQVKKAVLEGLGRSSLPNEFSPGILSKNLDILPTEVQAALVNKEQLPYLQTVLKSIKNRKDHGNPSRSAYTQENIREMKESGIEGMENIINSAKKPWSATLSKLGNRLMNWGQNKKADIFANPEEKFVAFERALAENPQLSENVVKLLKKKGESMNTAWSQSAKEKLSSLTERSLQEKIIDYLKESKESGLINNLIKALIAKR